MAYIYFYICIVLGHMNVCREDIFFSCFVLSSSASGLTCKENKPSILFLIYECEVICVKKQIKPLFAFVREHQVIYVKKINQFFSF